MCFSVLFLQPASADRWRIVLKGTTIEADKSETRGLRLNDSKSDTITVASGNVMMKREGYTLTADAAVYRYATTEFYAEGDLKLVMDKGVITADYLVMNLEEGRGIVVSVSADEVDLGPHC